MAPRSVVPPSQRRALARLIALPSASELYLAGGLAIAIHLGHRTSRDLDLFGPAERVDLERIRSELVRSSGQVEVVSQSDAALHLRVEGADVDFVRYPYAPLTPPRKGEFGVAVASLRDLAAMKLAAIARRGVRRDYWDLYAILSSGRVTLRRALEDFQTKFGVAESDVYHVLRALGWFEDAERDEVYPRGLTQARWREIRTFCEQAAAREMRRRARGAAR
jgi:hypothetical protein